METVRVLPDGAYAISSTPNLVNHPPHYNQGEIECIDAMRAALGHDGFVAFCRGAAMKYLWRCGHKDAPAQELQKAAWYIERAVREMLSSEGKACKL